MPFKARRSRLLIVLSLAVLFTGTAGFMILEQLSLVDALYFTIVTISTVGYEDINPTTVASKLDRRWTAEEDGLLRTMFRSSTEEDIMAALSGRSWKGITLRALKLKLSRDKRVGRGRAWVQQDNERLKAGYGKGKSHAIIAKELGRGIAAITTRVRAISDVSSERPRKRRVFWEFENLISSQQSSSRGGLKGIGAIRPPSIPMLQTVSFLQSPPSRARRNSATNSATSAIESSASISWMIRLPTITPSAIRPTLAACCGLAIPNPTHNGPVDTFLTRATNASRSDGRLSLAPVMPVTETR